MIARSGSLVQSPPSLRAPGISAVRGLHAAGVRSGLLPLPALRPRAPLLRRGLRPGCATGEPACCRTAVSGQPRGPARPRRAAAAVSRAPTREGDASRSPRGALVRDGAHLAGGECHGGARPGRRRGQHPCHSPSSPRGAARLLRALRPAGALRALRDACSDGAPAAPRPVPRSCVLRRRVPGDPARPPSRDSPPLLR